MTTDSQKAVPTVFEYRSVEDPKEVCLIGSWDKWSAQTPMRKGPDGKVWVTKKSLKPGRVTFKFVIDGRWVTGGAYDVVEDGYGGKNNARVIRPVEKQKKSSDGAQGEQPSGATDGGEPGNNDGTNGDQQEENNCVIC